VALKLPLLSAFVSLAAGALLFSLFFFFTPKRPFTGSPDFNASNFGTSCQVLIVDESEDDYSIQNKLASGGIDDYISESSQFIPIDDFGVLKFIPLDSFSGKIESFDPRDDGYAAKLSSFFVHDGKRFFFRLVESSSSRQADTEKLLSAILEGIPFTFLVLARGIQSAPVFYYYLFLAVGCVFALFFSSNRRLFVFQLPVLLSTGHAGFFSLILAAVLTGIWELLREPLLELFASRRYNRKARDYAGSGFRGVKECLRPFRLNLLFALLFFAFLPACSIAGLINPFLLLSACASFAFVYFLSFKTEEERMRKRSHIQFTPVLLLPYKAKTFSLFPLLLPFCLLAIFSFFLPSGYGYDEPSPVDSGFLVSSDDYNKHIAFEKSFSYTPLNRQNALIQDGYLRYYLGEDGLIAGNDVYAVSKESEALQFPLEKLMDFLVKYNKLVIGESAGFQKPLGKPAVTMLKEWISVAFIFIFCIFDIFKPRIMPKITFNIAFKKRVPVTGDKRIAA